MKPRSKSLIKISIFLFVFSLATFSSSYSQYINQDLSEFEDLNTSLRAPSKVLYEEYVDSASYYLKEDLYPEAKDLLWKAIDLFPENPDAYVNLAIVHIEEGNYEGAIRLLKQAQDLASSDYYQTEILCYNLGLASYMNAEYKQALDYLTQAISLYPDFPQAIFYSAMANEKIGQKESAFIDFFEARYLFEDQGQSLLKEKSQSKISELSRSHSLDTTSLAQRFFAKGKKAIKENNLEKATYFLEESVFLNPDYSEVYYELALINSRKKAPHNSIAYLNRIIEVEPKNPNAHVSLGYAYRDLRKFDAALKHLEKAKELDKTNATIRYDIGIVYLEYGKYNSARKFLIQAKKLAVTEKNLFLLEKINQAFSQIDVRVSAHDRPLATVKRIPPKPAAKSLYPHHMISGNGGSFDNGYFSPVPKPKSPEKSSKTRVSLMEF